MASCSDVLSAAVLGAMTSNQSTFALVWPAPSRATEVSVIVCPSASRPVRSKILTFFSSLPASESASSATSPSSVTLKATLSL